MSGESRRAATISPWFHRPGSNKAAEKAEINKPLSLCLSLCLPVYLHFTSKPSWTFLTPVWVFVTAQSPVFPSPKPVFVLDRVCLPAFISSSVWKQSDLPVVPALFQSVTGWLTDLWLIRVTYRRAVGTHTCSHSHINMNAQAGYSARDWPTVLDWKCVFRTQSNVIVYVKEIQLCRRGCRWVPFFLRIFGNMKTYQHTPTHKDLWLDYDIGGKAVENPEKLQKEVQI